MHNCIKKGVARRIATADALFKITQEKEKKKEALAQTWGGDAQKDIKSEEAGLWWARNGSTAKGRVVYANPSSCPFVPWYPSLGWPREVIGRQLQNCCGPAQRSETGNWTIEVVHNMVRMHMSSVQFSAECRHKWGWAGPDMSCKRLDSWIAKEVWESHFMRFTQLNLCNNIGILLMSWKDVPTPFSRYTQMNTLSLKTVTV